MIHSLNIKEVTDKNVWESFNTQPDFPSYFQSWNWGEVQKKAGIFLDRFGIYNDKRLLGIFQISEIKAKRGHFLHVRQGPVLEEWNKSLTLVFLNFLVNYAKKKRVSFARVSFPILLDNEIIPYLREIGFRDAPIHNVDAENRWILKLDENEDKLLLNMRKTTRYLIRKGEKEGIKITKSQNNKDLLKFLEIYKQTARIKHFVPHKLIQEEFETFKNDNRAYVYLANKEEKVLASAIIVYYGDEANYRHGATSFEGRNTPASYLLQWEAINDAKKSGLALYNFWGIAKDDNPKNPWFGLTQFKKGFGGERIDFIHCMDLPMKSSYWFSYLADYFTKIRKGYF